MTGNLQLDMGTNLVFKSSGRTMTISQQLLAESCELTIPAEDGTMATREWTKTYAVINRPGNLATSILGAMKSSELPIGMSAFNCQNSTDNPTGSGNIGTALICKHNLTGIWSYVWVFSGAGQIWFATISSTLPSSLTWTRKI